MRQGPGGECRCEAGPRTGAYQSKHRPSADGKDPRVPGQRRAPSGEQGNHGRFG